mgnify:CR=1 FL=1
MISLLTAALPLVGSLLDKIIPDPEARDQAKLELAKLQQQGDLKEIEVQMSAIVMEAKSRDAWTSRARPTFLYLIYVVILLCLGGGIIGVWAPEAVAQAAVNARGLFDSIPEELWWLFGTGYLGYTGARTWDKQQLLKGKK